MGSELIYGAIIFTVALFGAGVTYMVLQRRHVWVQNEHRTLRDRLRKRERELQIREMALVQQQLKISSTDQDESARSHDEQTTDDLKALQQKVVVYEEEIRRLQATCAQYERHAQQSPDGVHPGQATYLAHEREVLNQERQLLANVRAELKHYKMRLDSQAETLKTLALELKARHLRVQQREAALNAQDEAIDEGDGLGSIWAAYSKAEAGTLAHAQQTWFRLDMLDLDTPGYTPLSALLDSDADPEAWPTGASYQHEHLYQANDWTQYPLD